MSENTKITAHLHLRTKLGNVLYFSLDANVQIYRNIYIINIVIHQSLRVCLHKFQLPQKVCDLFENFDGLGVSFVRNHFSGAIGACLRNFMHFRTDFCCIFT